MTPFDQAFDNTMAHEGGYSNITGDASGETYRGVSRVWWPLWEGWLIVDDWKAGIIDKATLDMTLDAEVRRFYKMQFWDRFQGDKVAAISASVAIELFDTAVNIGVSAAVRFLQTALNMQNQYGKVYADMSVDGKLGQNTILTLQRYLTSQPGSREENELILLNCMNGEQYIYYKQNAQHERFRGWFKRV